MKTFGFFAAILAVAFSTLADFTNSLENLSPHFSTNTEILWQVPTNGLKKSFWIYKILPPHIFSATVISNAIVLASLQSKGFPKSSTNEFFIAEDKGPNYPGTTPIIFEIIPKSATLSYGLPNPVTNTSGIPADKILVQRAWTYAAQLGIDLRHVAFKEMTSHFNQDENSNELTNQISGRGVFLSRKLDGILFFSMGEDALDDGFWIEFGSQEQIRAFSIIWPDLKRDSLQLIASPQQIIAAIMAHRIIVLPNRNETDYFARVKNLSKAKKFIITKITPYYKEDIFGKTSTDDEPAKDVMPIAELEAVADFGNSNATVRLVSPILSSEVIRLLGSKNK